MQFVMPYYGLTHYDIKMGKDVARDAHCNITMGNGVVRNIHKNNSHDHLHIVITHLLLLKYGLFI